MGVLKRGRSDMECVPASHEAEAERKMTLSLMVQLTKKNNKKNNKKKKKNKNEK